MEITWHDDTCFAIKGKTKSLVINPHRKADKLKGEIVLNSLKTEETSEVEAAEKVFDWPGEYEMKNVPISAFQAWTKSKPKEEEGAGKAAKIDGTLIFCFEFGGVKFCHLGELGHTLTSDMVTEIGDVDILMIKVGEGSNLDAKKAMEIIEAIEPRALIPMGSTSAAALKDLAADKVEAVDKFVIKSASELPDEQMRCIVLSKA